MVDTFARDRLAKVLAAELPVRKPLLEQMSAERLDQLAEHCASAAISHGFEEANAALYFALIMVRMHPLFYQEPRIHLAGPG